MSRHGCLVLITGKAGIGKTALAARFADQAAACGVVVARGFCAECDGLPRSGGGPRCCGRLGRDETTSAAVSEAAAKMAEPETHLIGPGYPHRAPRSRSPP